ncbi:MAG: serine--tRNA ligase [Deltaproteobacteria bacterium]|nr:serine--tRNA ligase [Deltaproteobacteria bacterium]
MIDPRLLREDFNNVKRLLATRGLPESIDLYPELDEQRREALLKIEEIRANKNRLGPRIAQAKKEGADVSTLLEDLKRQGDLESQLAEDLEVIEQKLASIHHRIANIPDSSVPIGAGEEQNRVEKYWGEKPVFSFTPSAHWDVGEALNILDFPRAAKISGSRFAVYRGDGARLERALINFMLERHAKRGYQEMLVPILVRAEALFGSGQLPKFEADLFKTAGAEPQFYLIPTSEVSLCNLHADEILNAEDLPLYYTAYTPCFRAEAGSHGKDVRGLIRLHQFNKVELVKITSQETSFEELEMLTADAESILEELGLAYRRITLSSGDMGLAAAKTYDLEVWLPGLGCYREISSCSNTTDYQARRTKTRYRAAAGEKPKFVHMLNGSGLAVGRTVVAILENYQQEDGSVVIPQALRPYMNGQEVITKN